MFLSDHLHHSTPGTQCCDAPMLPPSSSSCRVLCCPSEVFGLLLSAWSSRKNRLSRSSVVDFFTPRIFLKKGSLILFLLLCFLLLDPLRGVTTAVPSDPAEAFLSAYQNFQQGERAEREGRKSDAFEKYQFAQSILINLSSNYPDWQRAVVDYRLAKVAQSLARISSASSDVASANTPLPREQQKQPLLPAATPQQTSTSAGNDMPSISIIPPSGGASANSKKSLSDQEMALLQQQLKKTKADLEKAEGTIADQATEIDHSKVVIVDMKSQLEKAERQVTDLKSDLSKFRLQSSQKEAQLQESVRALKGKVEALTADQEVVLEENSMLQQHLKQAADSLAAGIGAKGRLEQLQLEINTEKNASAALHEKLATAYHERDAANGQKEALQKQVQEMNSSLAATKKEAQEAVALRSRIDELQQAEAIKEKMLAEATAVAKKLEESQKIVTENQEKKATLDEAEKKTAQNTIKDLEEKLQQATAQIATFQKTNADTSELQSQIASLTNQLKESNKRLVEMDTARKTSDQTHGQALVDLENKLQLAVKEREMLEAKKTELDQQLSAANEKMKALEQSEQEQAGLKLELTQCKAQLQESAAKLAESGKKIATLEQAEPEKIRFLEEKEKELALARQESEKFQKDLAAANQKLSALQAEVQSKDDRYNELKKAFDDKNEELSNLKKNQEQRDKKEIAENELLKGIVLRELKAEAKRQQTKKLITEELEKLKLNSTTLSAELKKLAKPVKLTPEERALFKDTPLSVTPTENEEEETVVLSVAASKKEDAAASFAPLTSEQPVDPSLVSTSSLSNSASVLTNAPTNSANVTGTSTNRASQDEVIKKNKEAGDYHQIVAKAKEEFEHQHYTEAEKDFQDALVLMPHDYLILSNLGVVQFQLGKMSEAEVTLKKAADVDPKKSFALTTLGIVHYRQEHMDEAEKTLRQAIAINDQDFTAHNYLGIVLAAAGKAKAGESEIMKALELNQQYADAHFNLAVIYATGKPPAKEMAKSHYTKARALGAPPDGTLEKLLD